LTLFLFVKKKYPNSPHPLYNKMKNKKAIGILLAVIIAVSVFTVVIPGTASEPANTTVTAEPRVGIEELQQRVYKQGYNYAVAENWITRLSPEDRKALCGYKLLKAPTAPLPENVRFLSDVPKVKTKKLELQPPSYDAMALGYVTPIKNQICGACWLHGAIADFESDVAIGESNLLDFSEQEVGDCNIWASVGGHNYCDGGNAFMTTNYFTKYGAADEACHPYAAASQTCQDCPILKNVDNWRIITGSDGESQITTIKDAILNYGPVYSTIYANDAFMAYDSGVYEYKGAEETNHAIEIIGWDDSLGAWLIKNSWGTDWGRNSTYSGCGWVAYEAANLGDGTNAIASYKNLGDEIFYHDECGWMGYCLGCIGKTTAYGAVRFTPSQDLTLTSVDFWAVDVNMQYEIKVFDTISGGPLYTFSNQLGSTKTGSTTEKGYYSIPLDTPTPLVSGDDLIVQVKLTTTTGWGLPIPIDYANHISWLNWSTIATSSGESYASCDGSQFTKYGEDGIDIGIRARAEVSNQPPTASIDSVTPDPAEQAVDTVSFIGHGTDTDGAVVAYNWRSSIDGLLSTAPSFTKQASELSVGMHTISFKVQDDDGVWSTEDTKNLTINQHEVFDTCAGGYPSISGTHNGTITPNQDITVQKMYTYPCTGTGGHTKSARIYGNGVDKSASWTGYSGDWHNLTFSASFTLEAGKTYNYEITTGSYPQIIHEHSKPVTGGTITCTTFVDANGKEYNNGIPAIRLE
jgi:C1A family cysteine protease